MQNNGTKYERQLRINKGNVCVMKLWPHEYPGVDKKSTLIRSTALNGHGEDEIEV